MKHGSEPTIIIDVTVWHDDNNFLILGSEGGLAATTMERRAVVGTEGETKTPPATRNAKRTHADEVEEEAESADVGDDSASGRAD